VKAHILLLVPATLVLFLVGCSGPGHDDNTHQKKPPDEAEIRANLDKLSAEDRKLAEAQRWCAIQTKNRLGSMDAPVKIEVKGEPVFLCCESCRKKALADPDKTLATVKALKEKAASSPETGSYK
jgi:hypothetical protein